MVQTVGVRMHSATRQRVALRVLRRLLRRTPRSHPANEVPAAHGVDPRASAGGSGGGDTAHSLCWVVEGNHPVCVVLNTGSSEVHRQVRNAALASHTLIDVCHPDAPATTDTQGQGMMRCPPRSCAIYIDADDYGVMLEALSGTPAAGTVCA